MTRANVMCVTSLIRILCHVEGKDTRMIKSLKAAMDEWEKHTCIRFRPRKNETDYIEFYYGEG